MSARRRQGRRGARRPRRARRRWFTLTGAWAVVSVILVLVLILSLVASAFQPGT